MKKRVLSKIVMVSTAVLLLTVMMVSTLLGTTSAEYVKSLSQKLDFKAVPDLALKYYLSDEDAAIDNRTYICENAESIEQKFGFTGENGGGVRFHVAIPVYEVGVYTLKFKVRIDGTEKFTNDLNNPVGCQVVSSGDTNNAGKVFKFGATTEFRIDEDTKIENGTSATEGGLTADDSESYMFQKKPFFRAYDNYQWKTVAPAYVEYVELTFVAEQKDVYTKHVLWMWDFQGLRNPSGSGKLVNYTITLDEISWDKNDEPEANEPYVDFANMTYKNVAIMPTFNSSSKIATNYPEHSGNYNTDKDAKVDASGNVPTRYQSYQQGHNTAGITRECGGRGNYITQASTKGVTLQAEPVYYAYRHKAAPARNEKNKYEALAMDQPWLGADDEAMERHFKYLKDNRLTTDTHYNPTLYNYDFSNPLVYNVPIYNIKAGTSYKLTFDFSVAKQGRDILDARSSDGKETTDNTVVEDALYEKTLEKFFCSSSATTLHFQSYFYSRGISSPVQGYGIETTHAASARNHVKYANKNYANHWLTSYSEFTKADGSGNITTALGKTATSSVNTPSWYNAVKTVENNGENAITWLTFKNTTTSFNITGAGTTTFKKGDSVNILWVWAIDALQQSGWYRIKIDNVRLEEVVDYGSNIGDGSNAGIAIGEGNDTSDSTFANNVKTALNNTTTLSNSTANYRGANGTGQNFATRAYSGLLLPELNVYGPIYDMSDYKVKEKSDYKIYLSGYCVVKGGVHKYVWSADGGETWYDMIENAKNLPGNDKDDVFLDAADGRIDTRYKQMTLLGASARTTYVTFNDTDQDKSDFSGYRIYADISETKYYEQPNLDIIFAAVPLANSNLRCEILRITNFNAVQNYRTYTREIISDIVVGSTGTNLTAHYNADASATPTPHNTEIFTKFYSVNYYGYVANAGGYALRATYYHDYADIRTIYSDIPVKTQLTIRGWAMVDTGIEGFYWSPDDGVTWYPCSGATGSSEAGNTGLSTDLFGTSSSKGSQKYSWYDGDYKKPSSGDFLTKLYFDDASKGQGLTANLSAFAGKTIDVIFAAKSNAGGPYCPIGKIDNVAVYGDGSTDKPNDRGTFFTRVNKIIVDGATVDTFTAKYSDGTTLTYLDKWNLGTNLGYGGEHDEYLIGGLTYTPFEVCNTNIFHVRKASATPILVKNGGNIKISGFTFCPNGVNQYRYTLNGGITWEYIDANPIAEYYPSGTGVALTRAQRVDSTFKAKDGDNGNYIDSTEYYDSTNFAWTPLTINLPNNLAQDDVRDLLVVAESNNESGEPSGKLYPVFHQTIKVVGGDTIVQEDNVSPPNATFSTTIANLQSSSYTLNYSAIPEIPVKKGTYNNSSNFTGSSISVPKTYFYTDEAIDVTYTTSGSSGGAPWLAISHASNEAFYIKWWGLSHDSTATVNIKSGGEESGYGHEDPYVNLPAGEYKLWILQDCVWAKRYENMMVEPITIKIIDRNNPDLSYTHGVTTVKDNVNAKAVGTIKLDKTVFKNNETINFSFENSGLIDGSRVAILGLDDTDYHRLNRWSYASNKSLSTSGLAPGQYRLFYVSGSTIQAAISANTVYAIIDITILPDDASQTFELVYTDQTGTTQTYSPTIDVGGCINVNQVLNVMPGTQVQINVAYNNFAGMTGVERKFDFKPNG